MRPDSVLYLVPSTSTKNKMGDAISTPGIPREIFGEKKSVRQSEFYQAAATDYKPVLVFKVWIIEYQNENLLRYNEKDYKIIRTFEIDRQKMELICEGVMNHGNA